MPPYDAGSDMEPVSLGTTIMAASYDGGVILAADSRTSTGNYVANRAANKLTALSENVYICRSGSAADTQAVASYVQWYIAQHGAVTNRLPTVKEAAHLAMQLAYGNKSMLSAGLIVAGWDTMEGGTVWGLPLGGTLLKTPYATGGSGSIYITGFCDKYWVDNMSEADCRAFVMKAVSLAMARDGSSGGCIRLVRIDSSGVKREFITGSGIESHFGELRIS